MSPVLVKQVFTPGDRNHSFFQKNSLFLPPSLGRAVEKRQLDFLWGRYCAKKALELLGQSCAQLPIGTHRGPIWPEGFCGSITHTRGFAAAIACSQKSYLGMGIDAERFFPSAFPAKLARKIWTDEERKQLEHPDCHSEQVLLTIVFSAKESLYKALNPIVGEFFGFYAAKMLSLAQDSFTLILLRNIGQFPAGMTFSGIYEVLDNKLLLTQILIPRT